MIAYLRWELESYVALLMFLASHPEILNLIPEMAGDIDGLQNIVDKAEYAGVIQITPTSGITRDIKAEKLQMAKTIIRIAKKTRPLARTAKKMELFAQLNHPVSYINQAPKLVALLRAKAIRKAIKDNNTFFSNVKPADYTAMDTVILAYDTDHGKTRVTIEFKQVAGTDAISKLVQEGYLFRDNIVDFVEGYYVEDDPDLVDEMKKNIGIEMEGVHHTGIESLCVDGKPVEGAITNLLQDVEMLIIELGRKAKSDINGLATIIKFTPGTYHVTFKKTGYIDRVMIVRVKRGETLHLSVEMFRAQLINN